MFIELTDEWGVPILVNLDTVRKINIDSIIFFSANNKEVKVSESYEEIKLKMAGR